MDRKVYFSYLVPEGAHDLDEISCGNNIERMERYVSDLSIDLRARGVSCAYVENSGVGSGVGLALTCDDDFFRIGCNIIFEQGKLPYSVSCVNSEDYSVIELALSDVHSGSAVMERSRLSKLMEKIGVSSIFRSVFTDRKFV